jgi:hypothetical protein
LAGLQSWYHKHCDGEWEHGIGVRISTLDNPGWSLDLPLRGTELLGRPFAQQELEGDLEWYVCRVRDDRFEAFCGPNHLGVVIQIFLDWATTT